MSTNYYLYTKEPCKCCSRPYEPIHIGKSNAGWAFALHVIPSQNINTLEDWIKLWSLPGSYIENEYGERISTKAMYDIITARAFAFRSTDEYARRGPGSWDYILGEFS